MREVIQIQIGRSGNQIGARFWEVICDEHCIDFAGNLYSDSHIRVQRIPVYFNEAAGGKYVPRALFIDTDPSTLDAIRSGKFGDLYNPHYFIAGDVGAGNVWAEGYYGTGAKLTPQAMEITRNIAESTDCLQGFQFIHSLGGGTGSGMGSLLIEKLRDEYPNRILNSHLVIPSRMASDLVVEPYNTVLSMDSLIENLDGAFCFDNEALFNICTNKLQVDHPSHKDLNHLISLTMSGITTCFRFPGQLNADLRKLSTNMVPYPKLHFFIPGFLPLGSYNSHDSVDANILQMTQQIFAGNSLMADADLSKGLYLTVAAIFRGKTSMKEVEDAIASVQEESSNKFVESIPNGIKIAVCDIPLRALNISTTVMVNSTSITQVWERILHQFDAMNGKKAFHHMYTDAGLEESQFEKARGVTKELIDDYLMSFPEKSEDHLSSGTGSTRPATVSTRPTTDSTRPTTDSTRPTTDSTRPTTVSTRPTTVSTRPTTATTPPTTVAPSSTKDVENKKKSEDTENTRTSEKNETKVTPKGNDKDEEEEGHFLGG